MAKMTSETYWLAATVAMTAVFWVPYIVNRLAEHGWLNGLWDPHGITHTARPWADRMMRAHRNAIENLCIFAPLALMVAWTGAGTATTATAAMVYFFARLGHFVVFTFGVLRVALFLVGFGCQAAMAYALLGRA